MESDIILSKSRVQFSNKSVERVICCDIRIESLDVVMLTIQARKRCDYLSSYFTSYISTSGCQETHSFVKLQSDSDFTFSCLLFCLVVT